MGNYGRGTNEGLQANDNQQARHGLDFYDDETLGASDVMSGLIPLEDGCTFTAFNAWDGETHTAEAVPKGIYVAGHFFNITVVGRWMGIKADPKLAPVNEVP